MRTRLYLLFAVIVWGWTFVATKICLAYLSPIELLAGRLMLALPFLYLMLSVRKTALRIDKKQIPAIMLGASILAFHFFIQITGLKYTTATNTGWIISITPLVMAVLSFFILKERIGWREIIGIVIATTGILLLVSGGDIGAFGWLSSVGDWLVLASAHTWALYTIVTRNLLRTLAPMTLTFWVLLPGTILIGGYVALTSDLSRFTNLPAEPLVALLFLGLFGMALAHFCWQAGVAEVGATRAGIYLYLEPIATTALAVPYLNEQFGGWTAIGGGLVLAGVWWAQRGRNNRSALT